MKRWEFVPDSELDVALSVSSGQVFRWRALNEGGQRWRGVDGDTVLEAIRVDGGWKVRSYPCADAVFRYFQLDRSLKNITREILRRGPEMEPFLRAYPGLRLLKPSRADEVLFSFLCTPHNHLTRIVRLVETLAGYGTPLGDGIYEFPTARQLARVSERELRQKGFGYRAVSIARIARDLSAKGDCWLTSLRAKSYEEARSALCEFEGIGLKLADCVCLIGLGHEQAVPVDRHLWRRACDLFFREWRGAGLTERRYLTVGNFFRERFGDLAGWAHQYLFYHGILSYRGAERALYAAFGSGKPGQR